MSGKRTLPNYFSSAKNLSQPPIKKILLERIDEEHQQINTENHISTKMVFIVRVV